MQHIQQKANIITTSNMPQIISQNVFILLTLIASFAFIEPSFFGKLYALSIVFTIATIFNLLMCHLCLLCLIDNGIISKTSRLGNLANFWTYTTCDRRSMDAICAQGCHVHAAGCEKTPRPVLLVGISRLRAWWWQPLGRQWFRWQWNRAKSRLRLRVLFQCLSSLIFFIRWHSELYQKI